MTTLSARLYETLPGPNRKRSMNVAAALYFAAILTLYPLAKGMAEWGPADWAAFVPVVLAILAGFFKIRQDHAKAMQRIEAASAATVPPDQLREFAGIVAEEVAEKVAVRIARELRKPAPPQSDN